MLLKKVIGNIINKLFQPSRLEEYSSLLDFAISNGYLLTSLADWYENKFYPGRKVIVLRHDVDFNPEGAYKMFLIEKERNIKSTYYFRWSTAREKIIRAISSVGFEVSLHYETLATYCRKYKIYQAGLVSEEVIKDCRSILSKEVMDFEFKFGKIRTLSSHGEIWNMKVGIPNHILIDPLFYKELGIYFETYDQNVLSKFDKYISDSSIKTNHEWQYGLTPTEAINNQIKCICLLTHPHHWDYCLMQNIKMLLIALRIKLQNIETHIYCKKSNNFN